MTDSTKEAEGASTRSLTATQKMSKLIEEKIGEYNRYKFKDDNLWEAFRDDFYNFTAEDFKQATLPVQRALRTHLRTYGVWVKWDRKTTIAKSLYDVITETEPTQWTIEEVSSSNETFCSNKVVAIANLQTNPQETAPKLKQAQAYISTRSFEKRPSEVKLEQNIYDAEDTPPKPSQQDLGYERELANLVRMYD
ncbi:hypothetical protein K3495_g1308 [Podosphaera aphanis]|nr:hypothetical protein K3495_g1308 [Podosphaera aphanis]